MPNAIAGNKTAGHIRPQRERERERERESFRIKTVLVNTTKNIMQGEEKIPY
jgi:hypothetical protein